MALEPNGRMHRQSFSRFLATLALSYALLVAFLFLSQRHMIFPAPPVRLSSPAAGIERTTIVTPDGTSLDAWHAAPAAGRPVIVYFHGNGEQLSSGYDLFTKIADEGFGLVAIDYRGYGASGGRPSEGGLIEDGTAAWKFSADHYGADRTVLWGYSLGTGVAVAVAAERKVAAVVLAAPFSSLADVAADRMWFVPIRYLMLDQFRSDSRIKSVRAPMLFLHGDEDETVPIRYGRRLFDLAPEPKSFKTLVGADHYYLDNFGATDEAFKFIRQNTPPSAADKGNTR
jgi:fermentation-respiration switch protein FrsA (DUF1100 family)